MNLSSGKNPPEEIDVLIEIPQGTAVKYEYDKENGIIRVDRFQYGAFSYPFNYGFIPNTESGDGDPEDVVVISTYPVHPGVIIPSRPIGMLETEDESGLDNKIIAVPTKKVDPFYANVETLSDLPEALREKIKHFFEHYKELEKGKWVNVKRFFEKEAAYEDIRKSLKK